MLNSSTIHTIISFFSTTTARFLSIAIRGIRPLLGPAHCNYHVSCTQFALRELHTKPLGLAVWRICKRIISCNPLMHPKKGLE